MNGSPDEPVFFRLQDSQCTPYTRREYIGRYAWRFVESTIFRIPLPRKLRWQRRLLTLCGGRVEGMIHRTARVWHPWLLQIDPLVVVSDHTTIYNLARVSIGTQTIISHDVYLCAGTHDHQNPTMPLVRDERAEISIGRGVWICAGAFIGPGVTIGNNSVVGARSVVMRDVPAGVVVAGNPARVVSVRQPV